MKEGLTVFRDHEFSSDMNSRAVRRIDDVMILRSSQFSEDAGPMAHPVRPDEVKVFDNFYSSEHSRLYIQYSGNNLMRLLLIDVMILIHESYGFGRSVRVFGTSLKPH